MSKQSIALAYSRPLETLGETEYHALVQALSESARGRAFLEEHARRSRSAETKILLTAIERIEAQVRPRPPDPVYDDLGRVLDELRTARTRIESGGKVAQADQLGALLELLLRRITKMLPPSAAQAKRLAPPSAPTPAPAPAPRPAAARWLEDPLVPPPAVNDALPRPAASGIAAQVPVTPRPAPAVARRAPSPAQPAPARPASGVKIEDEIKVLVDTQVESRARKAPASAAAKAPETPRTITAKQALAAIMALSEEERIALFS